MLILGVVTVAGCTTPRFLAETARAVQERSTGSADPSRLHAGGAFEPGGPLQVVAVQQGEAAWYGAGAHGRRTASGEVFDRRGMTAAHLTFPLASTVRVTNLDNGRQVMLRINDRGEFGRYGRIIDVSERAAELLGFKSAGIAEVRVELVEAVAGQAAAAGSR
ncbi:MAG: septal ring lytic transglycosylase RlpA family protein [Alphaproteobacteria bacterium]